MKIGLHLLMFLLSQNSFAFLFCHSYPVIDHIFCPSSFSTSYTCSTLPCSLTLPVSFALPLLPLTFSTIPFHVPCHFTHLFLHFLLPSTCFPPSLQPQKLTTFHPLLFRLSFQAFSSRWTLLVYDEIRCNCYFPLRRGGRGSKEEKEKERRKIKKV